MKQVVVKLAFLFFIFNAVNLHAQMNVNTHFSSSGQKVGVGYTANRLNFDLSFFGVQDFENISPVFTTTATIIRKDIYNFFVGAGVITNTYFSLVFPVGVRVKPFSSAPRLGLKFDLAAIVGLDNNPNKLVPGLGISYSLSK